MNEPKKFIEGFYYLGATDECHRLVIKAVKRYDDNKILEVEVLEPNMETAIECGCIYVDYEMHEFTIIHNIMFSAKEKTKAPKQPDMVDVVRALVELPGGESMSIDVEYWSFNKNGFYKITAKDGRQYIVAFTRCVLIGESTGDAAE